ncbi:ferredoxin--NADP reductase [Vibrio sonorensis]|uniref:ferredoxin--NADP reductase n=1 Tax=Vibrio sonorensis TaxID=1004316 RepID=UPI0008D9E277|nr:ferredoxin--NADP reductase [Vibrio sonorensis]
MKKFAGFTAATVEQRTDWTQDLFSLRIGGAHLSFKAGQFTKLALPNENGDLISRAYSIVNAPLTSHDLIEFLLVSNRNGKLSPKLQGLKVGDTVYVGDKANGDLVFDTIPKSARDLWLFSTGTGIGPFLSLLDDMSFRPANECIILVHAVRHKGDLVYRYLIDQLVTQYEGRLTYVPVVSREKIPGVLQGRIPDLIEDGTFEKQLQLEFSQDKSFVMLCGNPEMIKDTQSVLLAKGLEKYRRATGGNIVYERYW